MNRLHLITIEPFDQRLDATCTICDGRKSFNTAYGTTWTLEEIAEAMTDHLDRNHPIDTGAIAR